LSSAEPISSEDGKVSKEMSLAVSVTYGDVKTEFAGSPEAVLQSVNNFLAKSIPQLSLAQKLSLNFSLADLANRFQEFVKITPEGPRVWNGERKFSDKELIALQLVAQRIASESSSGVSKSLSLSALQEITGLNPKSLSSRLSELAKNGLVERENSESGTSFKITTQGIDWLASTISKKQQSKN